MLPTLWKQFTYFWSYSVCESKAHDRVRLQQATNEAFGDIGKYILDMHLFFPSGELVQKIGAIVWFDHLIFSNLYLGPRMRHQSLAECHEHTFTPRGNLPYLVHLLACFGRCKEIGALGMMETVTWTLDWAGAMKRKRYLDGEMNEIKGKLNSYLCVNDSFSH